MWRDKYLSSDGSTRAEHEQVWSPLSFLTSFKVKQTEHLTPHVITQLVPQPWKDLIKTACKQNVKQHLIYFRQVISVYCSLFARDIN